MSEKYANKQRSANLTCQKYREIDQVLGIRIEIVYIIFPKRARYIAQNATTYPGP